MREKTIRFLYCRRNLGKAIIVLSLVYLWQNKMLLYDIVSTMSFGYLWVQAQFNAIGDLEYDWFVWVPFLLITGCMILGMLIYPNPPKPLRIIAVSILAVTHTLYIVFRTFNTLSFDTIGSGIVTSFLWISEVMFYVCSVSLYIQLMFSADRRNNANEYEKAVKSGEYQPWVDVFIPTYSEPLEMVRRTLVGCQAMQYPYKRIYLLDDGNRPEIQKLAGVLNCFYITRANNIHAKAGNINNALEQTKGELIAIFDADCVPSKNFLSRTAGFFQKSDIALVISAQSFYNADMFSHNIMSLMEQSRFFRHCQRGRDRFNALLCYGTCFIVRRKAMEDIGGMPTKTLSEDWATSIKLQAAGYKTYMLDEVLGAGAIAESMGEYVQQRIRWTQGTLQALFAPTNPFTIKGFSFIQRFIHSYSIFHYLLNPFYVLIVIIPVFYFFFGALPFHASRGQIWFFFIPFMCLNSLTFSWICREYTSRLSAFICESFMGIPLSIAVLKTLIRPFGWRFRVTHKGVFRNTVSINWVTAAPLIVFLLLLILGITYGYHIMHWYGSEEIFYFLFLWSILRIFAIWVGIYASFDFPQQRKSMRFNHKLVCLFNGPKQITGITVDISENGLLLKCKDKLEEIKKNSAGFVCIKDMELMHVPVRLIRIYDCYAAISFENMPLDTYRKLIEFLYCRPGQWEQETDIDKKVLKAIIKAFTFEGFMWRRKSIGVLANA